MKILVCLNIYQYIPGKLEYIQVWETRPTQFPQDPPQRSQFGLDRQFRPWKKEIISDKEKYINNSTNRMRKKESYTQWDLPTNKLISHNTGTLCRIFRCGNWSEPSWAVLAITHYRPWIICYMCFYFEQLFWIVTRKNILEQSLPWLQLSDLCLQPVEEKLFFW